MCLQVKFFDGSSFYYDDEDRRKVFEVLEREIASFLAAPGHNQTGALALSTVMFGGGRPEDVHIHWTVALPYEGPEVV